MSAPAISDDEIRLLSLDQGLSDDAIAERFRVSPRTVERARSRVGLVDKRRRRRPVKGEELARVRAVVREGMPLTWIAEDYRRAPSTYQRKLRPGMPPDWQSVWQEILKDPELLKLHYEFAPPRRR